MENKNSDYIKLLENCDKILGATSSGSVYYSNDYYNIINIGEYLNLNNTSSGQILSKRIYDKLANDGYVEKLSFEADHYVVKVNSMGKEFIELGGYIGKYKKEKTNEKQAEELTETTIKTNKETIKISKWNKTSIIINVLLTIINLIIAYFTYIKE